MAKDNGFDAGKVITGILSNQAVLTLLTIIAVLVAVWIFIGPAREFFSNLVDGMRKNLLDAFGGPADSQQTNERTRTDQLVGLFDEEDRALSDFIDEPFSTLKGLLFGTESDTPA